VREINEYASGKTPATADEVSKIQRSFTLRLPGSLETTTALTGSVADIVRFNRADDYVLQRSNRIKAITVDEVQSTASSTFKPDSLVWLVVGDLSKIRANIEALNLGPITVLDNDGNIVK
jgi:predicted Zn-dependent peptidase